MSHFIVSDWDTLVSIFITPVCLLAGTVMFVWWLISATYLGLSRVLISLLEVMRPDLYILNRDQVDSWRKEHTHTKKRAGEASERARILQQVVDIYQSQSRSIANHAVLVRNFQRALAENVATIRELKAQVTSLSSRVLLDQDGRLTEYGAKVRFAATLDTIRDVNRQHMKSAPSHQVTAFTVDFHPAEIFRKHGPQVTEDVCRELEQRLNTLKRRPSDMVTKVDGRYFLMFHHVTPANVEKVAQRIWSVFKASLNVTRPGGHEPLDVKVTPTVLSACESIESKMFLSPDAWFRRLFLMASENKPRQYVPTLELVTTVLQGQGSTLALAAA